MFGFAQEGTIENLTLSNMTVIATVNYYYGVGLLMGGGYNGTIDNITISGGSVTASGSYGYVAAIVGRYSTGTIQNCTSNASIEHQTSGAMNIGGIIGYISDSYTIENCSSTGNVTTAGCTRVGNFAGTLSGGGTIRKCFSSGNVTNSAGGYVGGFVGNIYQVTVEDCYSISNINVQSSWSVGGFFSSSPTASDNKPTFTRCYAAGTITGGSGGGFGGYSNYDNTYNNCFWDTETTNNSNGVSGGNVSGLTGKTTSEMKTNTTFLNAGWSGSIWYMDASSDFNDGYPYLHWQNPGGSPLPVGLLSFSVACNKGTVKLNWTTESEINNSGFDVERKRTENANWTKIGFVEGHGTVNTPQSYTFEDKNLISGKYSYRLKQIDHNGNYEYFNLSSDVLIGAPSKFNISQNYPNPFNPKTNISFELPYDSKISIVIFDMLGREVTTLVDGFKEAGYHIVEFDGSKLSSGMYFYRIHTESFESVKRMLLVK